MFRWPAVLFTVVIAGPAVLAAGDSRPTFESDILPILNAHCLQCHGGVHQKNELDLRTLAAVMKGGKSGTAVVPGKVEESLLWKKIAKDEMPKTDNKCRQARQAGGQPARLTGIRATLCRALAERFSANVRQRA
jgi:hypothetical protein